MRAMRPTCSHCIFWLTERVGGTATSGHCHRYPPGIYINPHTGTVVQKFPATDRHHWCGEWDGDEDRWMDALRTMSGSGLPATP